MKLFRVDNMMVDAVVRQLEIIGEAAKNVDNTFKEKYPNIPWDEMIGMRNALIHEYFGVDLKIVWDTCQEDLPRVKEIITKIF